MAKPGVKLTDGHILVGDISNQAADVAMSGDVTIDDTGATTIKSNVALAGSPTTTTQTAGDNSTKIATTAYVDTLADGEIRVGNSSNVATAVTVSGDVTMSDTGVTTIKSSVSLAGNPTTTTQSAGDNSTKIATTAYVDTTVGALTAGLDSRPSCRVATTAALTATYSNGSSGVGATLTNSGTQAALSIDGVALAVNDRVLVKNQATAAQNGIYTVTNGGSGSTNWVLTRAMDFDTASNTGVVEGAFTVIEEGTTLFGTLWIETGQGPFTIGTTAITFTQLQVTNVNLSDGHILVGNSSNIAADVAMSGDVTIDDTGVTTIKNDVALGGSPTTTTQSPGDNSTKIATTAYADAAASAAGGAMVLLDTQTASSSSSLDFLSSISSNYVQYVWILEDILLNASAGELFLRVSTDNSTFITSNTYNYGFLNIPFSGGSGVLGSAGQASVSAIALNTSIYSSHIVTGEVKLITTAGSYPQYFTYSTTALSAGNYPTVYMGSGQNTTTSQVLGVRFYLNTGNITSGKIRMYGIKAS